jgi:DNA-binding NtrC family response regulator
MNKKDESFRILIVDDNKDIRSIVEEYLSGNGHSVEGASDGKEALSKCRSDTYELIITDLNMPGLTGIELIKEVRKQNDMTEFVIITGYASLDTAVEAIKVGAFDYIVKPFRMEELDVVVKNVRDKISLKKTNVELFEKLRNFYEEIERYKDHNEQECSAAETQKSQRSDTERMVAAIKNLEGFAKGPLMIG